jgi:hypothetical protein
MAGDLEGRAAACKGKNAARVEKPWRAKAAPQEFLESLWHRFDMGGSRPELRGHGTGDSMDDRVAQHYSRDDGLAASIAAVLARAGKDMDRLGAADLATVDEFHIRGRKATLELAAAMALGPTSRVLDIGSGLGGPARTLAETPRLPRHRHRPDAGLLRGRDGNERLGRPGRSCRLPRGRCHRSAL